MDIVNLVENAFEAARRDEPTASSDGELHKLRSSFFVEELARQIRNHYANRTAVVVFLKHYEENRSKFGLNELLYDIAVCETASTLSASGQHDLRYVDNGLWAIESEFARDSKQAMVDFNKLVLSSADSKLFVVPQVTDQVAFIRPLAAAAQKCSGDLYLAAVPHPDSWDQTSDLRVQSWHWVGERWEPLGGNAAE